MSEDPLADFPVVIDIPVAWGDMDAFQHVNNTVYFRWFETARIAFFQQVGWLSDGGPPGVGPILAKTSCAFRRPTTFPDTVRVGAAFTDLGDDRFTMTYRAVSLAQGAVVAEGDGRIVSFDYPHGVKAPVPAHVVAAMKAL